MISSRRCSLLPPPSSPHSAAEREREETDSREHPPEEQTDGLRDERCRVRGDSCRHEPLTWEWRSRPSPRATVRRGAESPETPRSAHFLFVHFCAQSRRERKKKAAPRWRRCARCNRRMFGFSPQEGLSPKKDRRAWCIMSVSVKSQTCSAPSAHLDRRPRGRRRRAAVVRDAAPRGAKPGVCVCVFFRANNYNRISRSEPR